jgi:hypothetical protein
MLVVDDILFFPVKSIFWVFREIGEIAENELAGEAESITEQLRLLYMQLETGRITDAEFAAGEKLLLDRLEAIEERREANGEEDSDSGEDEEDGENEDEDEGEDNADEEEEDEDEDDGAEAEESGEEDGKDSDEDETEQTDEDETEESGEAERKPDEK